MLSHTGLDSVCPSGRGLPDEYLKRIAGVGGIIGITLFRPALCGEDLVKSFVTTVVHARSVLDSVDAIALGSDWDGRVFTIISAADTHVLASALLAEGSFSEKDVRKIMYENSFNFLARSLPMQATNPPVERI